MPASFRRNQEPPGMFASSVTTTAENTDDFTTGNKTEASSSTCWQQCSQSLNCSPQQSAKQGCQSPKLTRLHQQVTQFKLLRLAQSQGTQHAQCHICMSVDDIQFINNYNFIGMGFFVPCLHHFLSDLSVLQNTSFVHVFLLIVPHTMSSYSTKPVTLSHMFAAGRTRSPLRTSLRTLQAVRNSRSLEADDCQPTEQTTSSTIYSIDSLLKITNIFNRI